MSSLDICIISHHRRNVYVQSYSLHFSAVTEHRTESLNAAVTYRTQNDGLGLRSCRRQNISGNLSFEAVAARRSQPWQLTAWSRGYHQQNTGWRFKLSSCRNWNIRSTVGRRERFLKLCSCYRCAVRQTDSWNTAWAAPWITRYKVKFSSWHTVVYESTFKFRVKNTPDKYSKKKAIAALVHFGCSFVHLC